MKVISSTSAIVVALLWILASVFASAQQPQTVDPQQLLTQADHFAWLFNWPPATPLYEQAEKIFSERGDQRNAIHARIGRIRGQSETMSWPDVSALIAAELNNPVVQNNPQLKLWCLAAKGYTDLEIDPALAKQDWEAAHVVAKQLHRTDWESRASGELGIVAFLQGDPGRAVRLLGSAVLHSMVSGDAGAEIRYLSIIGQGMSTMNRQEQALGYFDRALKLAASTKDAGFPFMAYEGKAKALVASNRSAEASALLDTALAKAKEFDKRGHEAQLLEVKGELLLGMNRRPQAIDALQQAATLADEGHFYYVSKDSKLALAKIYEANGNLAAAEKWLTAGLNASRQLGYTYFLPRDLVHLAELKAKRGQLKEADAVYDEATALVEGMLVHAPSPMAEGILASSMDEIDLGHFGLVARQNKVGRAFEIVEHVRGRTIAEMLRSRSSVGTRQGLDQSPFEKEVSDLQARLIRADNPQERKELLDKLFVAEEEVSITIEQRNRLRAKDVGKPVPLAVVQRHLHPDELLIEYVLTEPAAYCLAIRRERARLIQLRAGKKQIEALATDYLAGVKAKRAVDDQARKLNSLLLQPVSVPPRARLVVVPDGKLHLLPFDSLRDERGHYVLESHIVTYAPSGTTLELIRSARRAKPILPFIGIGDVAYNDPRPNWRVTPPRTVEASTSRGLYDLAGAHFPALPGTREEVLRSGEIFGSGSVLLLGSNATETAFKAESLSKFAIVHIATHGIADPKFPERAALVLGQDAMATDDGLLQSREIIQLPLNADLVTLSACDTGAGRLQGEEGIANLVRAFLLAGAKTVLASTWSADDTFTTALMKQFYQHIADGQDEGTALQQAKLDLLHKFGDSTSPFYWAGFTMVGDGASRVSLSR